MPQYFGTQIAEVEQTTQIFKNKGRAIITLRSNPGSPAQIRGKFSEVSKGQ